MPRFLSSGAGQLDVLSLDIVTSGSVTSGAKPQGFLCFRLPDFPAWSAARAAPELSRLPLVVYRRERAIALSPQARACGLLPGWTVHRVRSRVPEAVLLPYDGAACAFAWEQVLLALYDFTPCIEPACPGMAFCEAPTRTETRQAVARLAVTLGACCGVAVDRPTALLASLTADAGVVRAIRTERALAFCDTVPVQALVDTGITAKVIERLRWFGVGAVGQLRRFNRRQLGEQFGQYPALLSSLWQFARAGTAQADRRPVATFRPPPAVEVRLSFEQPAMAPHECLSALDELVRRAVESLRGRGAGSLSLALETRAGRRASSRLLRDSVRTRRGLLDPSQALLENLLSEFAAEAFPEVEALSLRLGNLSEGAVQGMLFETREQRNQARLASLSHAARSLEERYPGALRQVRPLHPHSPLPEERFTTAPALPIIQALSIQAYHDALLGQASLGQARLGQSSAKTTARATAKAAARAASSTRDSQ
jgi:hypothetical protein